MQFLFSTGSLWSYSLERSFAFAAQAGFDGIEVMVDSRWESRQAAYLQGLVDRFQLPIVAIHSPFLANVPGWPPDHPGRVQATVRLAETVGAKVVVHHLPARIGYVWVQAGPRFFPIPVPGFNTEGPHRQWLSEAYAGLQNSTAVTLCIENMPAQRRLGRRWNAHHWNTPQEITHFPALTLDTTHLGTWGLDPETIYQSLNNHVRHVHLSNFDGKEHLRPETGHLRLDKLVARMAADGYQGAITLELHPEALDAGQPDEHIIERMTTSLRYCRTWAGK